MVCLEEKQLMHENYFLIDTLSANATAPLTLSSFSSMMQTALNFSAISIASGSLVTITISSICGDIEIVCKYLF